MIRRVEKIDETVMINNVFISVTDRTELDLLVLGIIDICPGVTFYASSGTYQFLTGILGPAETARHLIEVSKYTGQPETEGGLVKTLDFKLFLSYLTETYCEAHQNDLKRTGAVPIDLVVVNLYHFQDAVTSVGADFETARGNIDVGGPSALRAAVKNFLRVMTLTDPGDYSEFIRGLTFNKGFVLFGDRFKAALKTMELLKNDTVAITNYLEGMRHKIDQVAGCYQFS